MKGIQVSHLKSYYEHYKEKMSSKDSGVKPTILYSMKTQGKDHQQRTKHRMPTVKTHDF